MLLNLVICRLDWTAINKLRVLPQDCGSSEVLAATTCFEKETFVAAEHFFLTIQQKCSGKHCFFVKLLFLFAVSYVRIQIKEQIWKIKRRTKLLIIVANHTNNDFERRISPIIKFLSDQMLRVSSIDRAIVAVDAVTELNELDEYGENLLRIFTLMSKGHYWNTGVGTLLVKDVYTQASGIDAHQKYGLTEHTERTLFHTSNSNIAVDIELDAHYNQDCFIVSLDVFADPDYLGKYKVYLDKYESAEKERKQKAQKDYEAHERERKIALFNQLQKELYG